MRRRRLFAVARKNPPPARTSPCDRPDRTPRFFLASFQPLSHTAAGRSASEEFGLPPFIDGSCRREPDLQGALPSITALCRGLNFAPRLCVGDHVIYMTIKFGPASDPRVRRLVAALKVVRRFESHAEAKGWYADRGEDLPSNCCVRGNGPVPIAETSYPHWDLAEWDAVYRRDAKLIGTFLACEPIVRRLNDAPVVSDAALRRIFKRIPCTQTPPQISEWEFERLLSLLRAGAPARRRK